MNENQSAHGDREYGHIVTRMGIEQQSHCRPLGRQRGTGAIWHPGCVLQSVSWRAAISVSCRVADNMRNVAVTEGDKVEAQIKFGWEVDAYPVNEIAE